MGPWAPACASASSVRWASRCAAWRRFGCQQLAGPGGSHRHVGLARRRRAGVCAPPRRRRLRHRRGRAGRGAARLRNGPARPRGPTDYAVGIAFYGRAAGRIQLSPDWSVRLDVIGGSTAASGPSSVTQDSPDSHVLGRRIRGGAGRHRELLAMTEPSAGPADTHGCMFSRTIVRISVVVGVAFCLQQPAAFAQPADAIRKGHAAQPRSDRGGRQARVREGARAAEARAGFVQELGPRTASRRRAHAHPHGRRDHPGLQESRAGEEAVRQGARHRSEHHDHEVAVDARPGGGVRGGEGRRQRARGRRRRRRRARRHRPRRGARPAAETRTDAPSSSGSATTRSARSSRGRASSSPSPSTRA